MNTRGKAFLIFLAVVLVGGGGIYLYKAHSGRGVAKRPQVAGVCPECGQKLPRQSDDCPYCRYKRNFERSTGATGPRKNNHVALKLGICFGMLALAALILNWGQLRRILRERRRQRELVFLPMTCQNCKRRLRYLATSAGKQGQCPKCGGICTFPAIEAVRSGSAAPESP